MSYTTSQVILLFWSITFLLTVFANLTLAVEVGLVLAAILFVKACSSGLMTVAKVLPDEALGNKKINAYVA